MQKSIALALLFGSSSALVPGPLPTVADDWIMFESGSTDLASGTPTDDQVIQSKRDIVTSGGKNAGLYGCLRSGMVPMATQPLAVVSRDSIQVGTTQIDGARSFYQNTLAMQGTLATIKKSTGETDVKPFDGVGPVGDENDATVATAVAALKAALTGSYFECCAPGNVGDTLPLIKQCPTQWSLAYSDSTSGSLPSDVAAIVTVGTLPGAIANRLNFYNDQSVSTNPFGETQVTMSFNPDFILAAQAQLSDEATAGDNWCNMAFKTEITTTATYSVNAGFNSNTKCSWQVSAVTGSAPQFQLASTTTNAANLIQWVEWTGGAGADALTAFASNSILVPAQEAAAVATNYAIGDYTAADGAFFNPFQEALESGASVYKNDSDESVDVWEADNTGFEKYEHDANIAGSPGKAMYWPNLAGNLDYQKATQKTQDSLDMGIFTTALAYAKPAYASYDAALTTFNTDAAAYNEAVEAYNTALEAKEKELPVVMVRPCPPTKPAAINGVTFANIDTEDVTTQILTATTSIVEYRQQNDNTIALNDAKRFGYVMSANEYLAATEFDSATAHAGHVFGRLGQGKWNMPGMYSPWKWNTDAASEFQYMMISVFPNQGTDYGVDGVLGENEKIDIEISSAALSMTSGFEMPSASATAALALTDKDAAQALVFSAVALAAAVASLY